MLALHTHHNDGTAPLQPSADPTVPISIEIDNETNGFNVKYSFFIGSPLGLQLSHRYHCSIPEVAPPGCEQCYNVFYSIDPLASRIEPFLNETLGKLEAAIIPRLTEWNISHQDLTLSSALNQVESSSKTPENYTNTLHGNETEGNTALRQDTERWWGSQKNDRRLDYQLQCSHSELASRLGVFHDLPRTSLVQLIQSSYWENRDFVAFFLQEIFREPSTPNADLSPTRSVTLGDLNQNSPKLKPVMFEKWLRPHRLLKIRRPVPNHHAPDVFYVLNNESGDDKITVTGRMAYGAMDMIELSGEKVDFHMEASNNWHYVATTCTDDHGRVAFNISMQELMQINPNLTTPGFHKGMLVVRGDHSSAALTIAIVNSGLKVVIFSIDGSFSASMSLSGANPKLHPGSIDVVRHWANSGYLVIYISSRPDSQQNQVIAWLSSKFFLYFLTFCLNFFLVFRTQFSTGLSLLSIVWNFL